ncbi:GntR family transcriptional regulator [Streptosporangium sp. NPDC050855]|uniref:GntR family transcriptional regulator n=1 Tax=Streptosporangium sp. NPDC050855 TaxID=3366194 RepID=UPI0037B94E6E
MQVVKHIREQIESGALHDGDTVPSTRKIAEDWKISLATATKALATLRSEGLVRGVSGVGTVVTTSERVHTPTGRVLSNRRTGRIYPPDEHARIEEAELVSASEQVADALGLSVGAPVIRRRRVTYKGETPVSASISWFDGALAEIAPKLLETARILEGTFGYIEAATGRQLKTVRDQVAADEATGQDANDLRVQVGSPVLRGRNWIYDTDGGVVEYGEYVSATRRWKSYDYEIN